MGRQSVARLRRIRICLRHKAAFTDNPNSSARRKRLDGQVLPQIGVFASGNRTRIAEFAFSGSLTVSNHPCLSDNLQLSAHRNGGDQPDSHRHKRLHGA